jgi:hypothetical protein
MLSENYFKPIYMKDPRVIHRSSDEPENVWTFHIPTFKVEDDGLKDGEGQFIFLCRGNKTDPSAPRQEGVFTETLLQVCKEYLEGVNKGDLASRETSMAITKIDEALMWIQKRADDRKRRDVQGTYKP